MNGRIVACAAVVAALNFAAWFSDGHPYTGNLVFAIIASIVLVAAITPWGRR